MASSKRTTGETIGKVIVKQNGNRLSVDLPDNATVAEGAEFLLIQQDNGDLLFKAPDENGGWQIDELAHKLKNDNPWTNGEYDDYDFRKALEDTGNYGMQKPVGREIPEPYEGEESTPKNRQSKPASYFDTIDFEKELADLGDVDDERPDHS
ncbi:hypothetical protein [Secundilactobacillus similis]|uniref:Uncharacterized protein n=1 Tax=Secundilactobacillus similis DSM 23365 = JCM 2765 TaxID=1423804 RepID=A0A0R2EXH8_9LACO|nr:hypothetical protein [Secundilactobacillus similis]KRN21144.1 hypothetical protein FD14_GL001265 [Secundilactobacillus similis DSM 23365 = JCM 2765]